MKHLLLPIAAVLSVAACSPTATAPVSAGTVNSVIADGQLFCAVRGSVVALAAVSGGNVMPVLAKGASSSYVKAACNFIGGLAVAPPLVPGSAPTVVIPSLAIPLRS